MSQAAPPDPWNQPRVSPRRRLGWVGFEGIIASGKTTQSRLLAEHLPATPTSCRNSATTSSAGS